MRELFFYILEYYTYMRVTHKTNPSHQEVKDFHILTTTTKTGAPFFFFTCTFMAIYGATCVFKLMVYILLAILSHKQQP